MSDGISRVLVSWNGRSGYTTSPLWILLPPEMQIPDDPPLVNIQSSGSAWVTWQGRMYAAGYGTRTLPVPLGTQTIRARIYSGTSTQKNVNFVANSYDSDADDFSDAVEDENAGIGGPVTTISYEGNTYYYSRTSNTSPPMIPTTIGSSSAWYYNRGTHDYSLARGTVSNGSLHNGLRIANSGTGYQYWWGGDPLDYDNWGILELINIVERTGREWNRQHSDYPILTSLDMSLGVGGSFPPHTQHQNGLEVDMRYIRNDASSGICDLYLEPGDPDGQANPQDYSQQRTQQLIDILVQLPQVSQVIVHQYANISSHAKVTIDPNINNHTDHMHIRINDPDGGNWEINT